MRLAGRISDWNDDRGYGFVTPLEGGDRAFVHIKAFPFGSRRPVNGDLISYQASQDARGRTNATAALHDGQKIEPRKSAQPLPRQALGVIFLLAVSLGTSLGVVPAMIAVGYMLLSCLSYIMYALDKAAAGENMQRTPENTLHFVDMLGGWPGALIAQQQFRHKTVKASFQQVFWFTAFVNVVAVAWLVRSGIALSIPATLHGGELWR